MEKFTSNVFRKLCETASVLKSTFLAVHVLFHDLGFVFTCSLFAESVQIVVLPEKASLHFM